MSSSSTKTPAQDMSVQPRKEVGADNLGNLPEAPCTLDVLHGVPQCVGDGCETFCSRSAIEGRGKALSDHRVISPSGGGLKGHPAPLDVERKHREAGIESRTDPVYDPLCMVLQLLSGKDDCPITQEKVEDAVSPSVEPRVLGKDATPTTTTLTTVTSTAEGLHLYETGFPQLNLSGPTTLAAPTAVSAPTSAIGRAVDSPATLVGVSFLSGVLVAAFVWMSVIHIRGARRAARKRVARFGSVESNV